MREPNWSQPQEAKVSQNITANLREISLQKHILTYLTTVSGRTGLSGASGPVVGPLQPGGQGPGRPSADDSCRGPGSHSHSALGKETESSPLEQGPLGGAARGLHRPTLQKRAQCPAPTAASRASSASLAQFPQSLLWASVIASRRRFLAPAENAVRGRGSARAAPVSCASGNPAHSSAPARARFTRAPGGPAPEPQRSASCSRVRSPRRYRWPAGHPALLSRPGLRPLPPRGRRGSCLKRTEPGALPAYGLLISPPQSLPPTSLGGFKASRSFWFILVLPPPVPPFWSSEPARVTAPPRRIARVVAELGGGGGGKREGGAGGYRAQGEAVGWGKLILAGLSRSSCW